MKKKYRQSLIDFMNAAFPAPPQLDAFIRAFRPGAVFLAKGKPNAERITAIVDDAMKRFDGWVLVLLEQLEAQFAGDPTLKTLRLAAERDIVDEYPYPEHLPLAQELERILATLYLDDNKLFALIRRHGVEPYDLPVGATGLGRWRAILRLAAEKNTTRALVEDAVKQHAASSIVGTLRNLLDEVPVPISPMEPPEGGNGFLKGDDTVEEESLLYYDDLTISVGEVESLLEAVAAVMASSGAVCLLTVEVAAGYKYYGTGFRIGNDLVLTNHHVLVPKGQQATAVTVDFNVELTATGARTAPVSLVGDVSSIIAEKPDDWGVIKVPGMDPAWPIIDLTKVATPALGKPAFILQHPAGNPKRLGFVRNRVSFFDDQVVQYLTDTQPGSSGAPVFDATGTLMAVHHIGGKPQQVAGKPPVSNNEGIRVDRIVERMRDKQVKVEP